MPIYEYRCPIHDKFEVLQQSRKDETYICPECGQESPRIFSQIGLVRVHHTEKLDYNDPLRVYDRQRMAKDSAVKKALADYAEEQRELPNSPFKGR